MSFKTASPLIPDVAWPSSCDRCYVKLVLWPTKSQSVLQQRLRLKLVIWLGYKPFESNSLKINSSPVAKLWSSRITKFESLHVK